jgi:hypothetical protein
MRKGLNGRVLEECPGCCNVLDCDFGLQVRASAQSNQFILHVLPYLTGKQQLTHVKIKSNSKLLKGLRICKSSATVGY